MNIKRLYHIFILLLLTAVPATAQEKDTLSAFIENHPNAVDFNVIHEGTKLNLSADDDYLLVNLSVAHPALQMRFLMQSVSLYLDPSGKKKKKYEVILPSAIDVRDELESANPQAETVKDANARPDIRPLISALNKRGAEYKFEGGSLHLGYQHFYIELDAKNDLVNYYVLLPKEQLMQDRKLSDNWTIGIFSINDMANMPPPEQGGEGGMMPPPMEGENQQDIQELMQSDIREWTSFSIDDVNNANEHRLMIFDDLETSVRESNDSLLFCIKSHQIETQLALLMQGLTICLDQGDSLALAFPSAAMVRNKVKRHPNEVKAVLDSHKQHPVGHDRENHVVRPDVQPLIAALNDTTATLSTAAGQREPTRHFRIAVDKETEVMTFSISASKKTVSHPQDHITLTLMSKPFTGPRQEFSGNRLSQEQAPLPQGLGGGLRQEDISARTLHKTITISLK